MYVVDYNGQPAMALGFLFDNGYCDDIVGHRATTVEHESFLEATKKEAQELSKDACLNDCEILFGKNTDPDGHEILVIIPYAKRNEIKDIAQHLDKTVYFCFKNIYKAKLR